MYHLFIYFFVTIKKSQNMQNAFNKKKASKKRKIGTYQNVKTDFITVFNNFMQKNKIKKNKNQPS